MHSETVSNILLSKFLFYFLAVLVLLPSVTFGLLAAEVFPWALIFYFIYGRSIDRLLLLIASYMVLSALYVVFVHGSGVLTEVFRSFLAYLNALLIFNLIMTSSRYKVSLWVKVISFLFVMLIVWGVIQHTGILAQYDYFIKYIVPRGYTYSLSFMGGRGVTLMASEPARAGVELIFIYFVVRLTTCSNSYRLFLDAIVLIFLALIIKSAISLLFFIVCLAIFYRAKSLLVIGVSLFLFPFFVGILSPLNSRAITLIVDLYQNSDVGSLLYTLSNTGGHRLVSIYTSYLYGVINPFGGGLGNWQLSSIESLTLAGIDTSNIQYFKVHGDGGAVSFRSSGFVSNLMIDLGVVGLLVFFGFLYKQLKYHWKCDSENRSLIYIFVLKILFVGSVGNPVAWACLAVALKVKQFKGLHS